MLAFIVICIVLAISAAYELIEWAAALALGQGADEFLGTQGDPWDTQSDMFCALIGSITALCLFSRMQDRQIERLYSPWSNALAAARGAMPRRIASISSIRIPRGHGNLKPRPLRSWQCCRPSKDFASSISAAPPFPASGRSPSSISW